MFELKNDTRPVADRTAARRYSLRAWATCASGRTDSSGRAAAAESGHGSEGRRRAEFPASPFPRNPPADQLRLTTDRRRACVVASGVTCAASRGVPHRGVRPGAKCRRSPAFRRAAIGPRCNALPTAHSGASRFRPKRAFSLTTAKRVSPVFLRCASCRPARCARGPSGGRYLSRFAPRRCRSLAPCPVAIEAPVRRPHNSKGLRS